MPGRILALVCKEFAVLWNDKKTRLLILIPPLIQLLVFGLCATMEIRNIHFAIWNRDQGEAGRQLIQRLEGSPTFTKLIFVASDNELKKCLDEAQVLGGLVIPPDFSRNLARGQAPRLAILLDGRRSNTAQLVSGYLAEIASSFFSQASATLVPATPAASVTTQVPQAITRHWHNPNLIYQWFTLPALIGIVTIMITTTISCLSVAREKEEGTFEQLLVSPLTPAEIMIAKAVPGMVVSLLEASILAAATIFLFGVPMRGNLLSLYAALTFFSLSITGVGLFLSSLARTQQQAILGAFLFLAPAILLSGFATPVDNMPGWLQTATQINPIRLFLEIILEIMLKGGGFHAIAGRLAALGAIAAATLSAGAWLFRHRLD